MFKKFRLSITAAILAIAAVLLTSVTPEQVKAAPRFTEFFWRLDNAAAPLQGSSYTQVNEMAYDAITCSGSTKTCKLISSSSSLPSTLADGNGNNIPDETGSVLEVETKN